MTIILKGERRKRINERKLKLNIPQTVILSVTRKCNLSCRGCYAIKNSTGYPLDNDEIQSIIYESIQLGSYIFIITGGEPLMVPGLISLLTRNKNALFILITNGTLINDDVVSQLKNSRNILPVISVDGEKNEVEYRRSPHVWQKIKSALRLFRLNRIAFGVSIMLTRQNLLTVLNIDWMKSIWEKGASFGFLLDYLPFDHSQTQSFKLKKKDLLLKRPLLEDLRIKSPLPLFVFPEGNYCNSNCYFLRDRMIHITANGMVEPCPFCQVSMDSIREKPLAEILRSNFFKELHREFDHNPDQNTSCVLFDNKEKIRSISEEIHSTEPESMYNN